MPFKQKKNPQLILYYLAILKFWISWQFLIMALILSGLFQPGKNMLRRSQE